MPPKSTKALFTEGGARPLETKEGEVPNPPESNKVKISIVPKPSKPNPNKPNEALLKMLESAPPAPAKKPRRRGPEEMNMAISFEVARHLKYLCENNLISRPQAEAMIAAAETKAPMQAAETKAPMQAAETKAPMQAEEQIVRPKQGRIF